MTFNFVNNYLYIYIQQEVDATFKILVFLVYGSHCEDLMILKYHALCFSSHCPRESNMELTLR